MEHLKGTENLDEVLQRIEASPKEINSRIKGQAAAAIGIDIRRGAYRDTMNDCVRLRREVLIESGETDDSATEKIRSKLVRAFNGELTRIEESANETYESSKLLLLGASLRDLFPGGNIDSRLDSVRQPFSSKQIIALLKSDSVFRKDVISTILDNPLLSEDILSEEEEKELHLLITVAFIEKSGEYYRFTSKAVGKIRTGAADPDPVDYSYLSDIAEYLR